MEARTDAIAQGKAEECVWLLEHPPLYTGGTSAKAADLLDARFPVYQTGRGGEYTYHGPGQRVAYVMLDLKRLFAPQEPDLRAYINRLEQWIIAALSEFGVEGFVREGWIGVWVNESPESRVQSPVSIQESDSRYWTPGTEKKIAAIGVRVRKWISFHGICINVQPDLSHYAGIVPCGIKEYGVTSLEKLGVKATMENVDAALKKTFTPLFRPCC